MQPYKHRAVTNVNYTNTRTLRNTTYIGTRKIFPSLPDSLFPPTQLRQSRHRQPSHRGDLPSRDDDDPTPITLQPLPRGRSRAIRSRNLHAHAYTHRETYTFFPPYIHRALATGRSPPIPVSITCSPCLVFLAIYPRAQDAQEERERERETARRQQQKQPFGVLVVLLFPPLVLQCGLEIDGRVMGERERGGGELAASAFEVHSVREKRGGRRFCFARLRGEEGLELLFSLSLSHAGRFYARGE